MSTHLSRRILGRLTAVLVTAVALAACADARRPPRGWQDLGDGVSLSPDRTRVRVVKDSNATTPYRWTYVAEPEGVLVEVGSGYVQDPNPFGTSGTGGVSWWELKAADDGETALTFTYAHAAPSGASAASSVTHSFTVLDGEITRTGGGAGSHPTEEPTEKPTEDTDWEEQDGGVSLSADRTRVRLCKEANHTTPYTWVYTAEPEGVLVETGSGYEQYEHPEGLVGVGGTSWWELAVASDGTTTLTFVYERTAPPTQTEPSTVIHTFTVVDGLVTDVSTGHPSVGSGRLNGGLARR